jgi:hypothetical protein
MVAGLAFLAFLAFVFVVFFVAREAIVFQFVLVQIPFMATDALGIDVLSEQRIFGFLVMVENDCFPTLLCVTGFALGAEIPFVFVVFLVA